MSKYRTVGTKDAFKPPQPWIFKPINLFRTKLILMLFLVLLITYLFIIIFSIIYPTSELQFLYDTLFIVLYFIIALLYIKLYANSLEYQVHGSEIIIKKGPFNVTENHIPFSNITNISIRQGPLDQLFGIGTIKIYTGGSQLNSIRVAAIEGIRIYEDVGYFILNQIKYYESFFTYLLDERRFKSELDKKFWNEFFNLVKEIKFVVEKK